MFIKLTNVDAKRILGIPYRDRLSFVSPKLLSAIEVEGRQVLLAGVDFDSELKLKRWWHISGQNPEGEQDVLVGYEVARAPSIIEPAAGTTPQSVSHGGSHQPSEDQSSSR